MKPLHGRALVLVFFATLVALVGLAVWFVTGTPARATAGRWRRSTRTDAGLPTS